MPHGESGHEPMKYWYNVSTGQVEDNDHRGRAKDLLGPYDSIEAAEQALETAKARNEAWDAQDKEWD